MGGPGSASVTGWEASSASGDDGGDVSLSYSDDAVLASGDEGLAMVHPLACL